PERSASVINPRFSPDGARLFATGYPSGIVQIFDVEARKQLVRIDTPAGYKGTNRYALLTPDWKTIFVPVERRRVESIEKDGVRSRRFNFSGEIRVFDAVTGKEGRALQPAPNHAPIAGHIPPDGKYLTYVERPSQDVKDTEAKDRTMLLELSTGKKTEI